MACGLGDTLMTGLATGDGCTVCDDSSTLVLLCNNDGPFTATIQWTIRCNICSSFFLQRYSHTIRITRDSE